MYQYAENTRRFRRNRWVWLCAGWLALIGAIAPGDEQPTAADDDFFQVHLWPLLENARLDDGRHRVLFLYLYHETREPDGSLDSFNLLNYYRTPTTTAVLPLFYRFGDPGQKRTWLVPLWFQGPDYVVAPLLLSAGWKQADSGHTLWITPLSHWNHDADGTMSSWHVANFFHTRKTDLLFPVAWRSGSHYGVLPIWLSGPGYWCVPPALSAKFPTGDGGSSTWITPLTHWRRDIDGEVASFHILNFFHDEQRDVVFPLAWINRQSGNAGFIPAYFQGKDWWFSPLALSGGQHDANGSTLWITPLFHLSQSRSEHSSSMHLLTYFSGQRGGGRDEQGHDLPSSGYRTAFPLYFRTWRTENGRSSDATVVLPALSVQRRSENGERSLWITPLFHIDRNADGRLADFHALTYFQSGKNSGLLPIYLRGPKFWVATVALSFGWKRADGGRNLWITPFCHLGFDGQGELTDWHAFTYWKNKHGQMFLPLAWSFGDKRAVLPFYLCTSHYAISPLLLSGRWKTADGGTSWWVTPLAHRRTRADGTVAAWHFGNIVHSGRTTAILPIAWKHDDKQVFLPFYFSGKHHRVIAPLYFRHHSSWVAPLALSGHWKNDRGKETTLVTPLYHRTTQDGTTQHQHLGPYFQWRSNSGTLRRLLVPFYYRRSQAADESTSILPPLFTYHRGETLDDSFAYQLIPFLVQKTSDGSEVNFLWRLFHQRRKAEVRETTLAWFWWNERHPRQPSRWQILGGLVGRDCNYKTGTYRYQAFWIFPVGPRHSFKKPATQTL